MQAELATIFMAMRVYVCVCVFGVCTEYNRTCCLSGCRAADVADIAGFATQPHNELPMPSCIAATTRAAK